MLSKLFSKRQKTEPLPEKPTGNCRMVSEEDMQRYEFQEKLFQTIVSVEADAHVRWQTSVRSDLFLF